MAYPALFRHLFGDNPVRPFKFRKELIPLDVDKFNQWYDQMETWRKSLIGCLIPTTMATLPSCLGIPDGSLFLFEDYPELKEKYDAGGFNGMLLESTATSEEKDAWRGKWIKHPQGLGLYSPRLSGLFLRNGVTAGKYNVAGLPEILGVLQPRTLESKVSGQAGAIVGAAGAFALSVQGGGGNTASLVASGDSFTADSITLRASLSSSVYAASSTVMPASVNVVAGLYLGRTA